MPSRTPLLAALGVTAVLAMAGGPAATVLIQSAGNTTGLTTSSQHRADASQHESAPETSPTPAATPSLPPCPSDVANHGAYVSSVAKMNHGQSGEHGKPAAADFSHGNLVSLAAQSDCGKPAGGDASESPENDSNDDANESAGPDGQHGHAGKSHGKSASHIPGQAPVAP